ncbi:beta-lactam-binding protein with PASTA domain [Streptacidiphilus sp. MAP12-16]|uniref:PASTA domain-containing protein n=1 Tax=Streptacidiphilus sp. MAP12-16 TaxID=3156300 RepID=UPI003512C09C
MASSPGRQPILVTVPDLVGLRAQQARDFAHRAQLVAVGPDPDLGPTIIGTVTRQDPPPGALAARWSIVTIWTTRGGPGDAGVREPRIPSPPPLAVSVHDPEPVPVPEPEGEVATTLEEGD